MYINICIRNRSGLSAAQKKLEAAEEKIKDLTANLEKEKEASRRLAVQCGNLPDAKQRT